MTAAQRVIDGLRDRQLTVSTAESLTGGLVASAIVEVPGASDVFRGGVIAYATELKHDILAVDAALLAEHGAVHPDVAVEMATGVRERCSSDWGVATTGVAGPDPQDGHPVGEVYVAVVTGLGSEVRGLFLTGDRADIRAATVHAALDLLEECLEDLGPAHSGDAAPS